MKTRRIYGFILRRNNVDATAGVGRRRLPGREATYLAMKPLFQEERAFTRPNPRPRHRTIAMPSGLETQSLAVDPSVAPVVLVAMFIAFLLGAVGPFALCVLGH